MTKLAGFLAALMISAALLLISVIAGQWLSIHFLHMPRWFSSAVGVVSSLMLILVSMKTWREKQKQEQMPLTPLRRAPLKGSGQISDDGP